MDNFKIWFVLGFEHIVSVDGYDHVLFIALLAFAFSLKQLKNLLWLITAFTLGHSLSLALGAYKLFEAPRLLTEFLIAFSILAAALYHFLVQDEKTKKNISITYGITLIFGLIHGLGFSYSLSAMLGYEGQVLAPLLYFNLGLEAGQIIVLSAIVLFSLILTRFANLPFKLYKQTTVCLIAIIALVLCAQRGLQLFH